MIARALPQTAPRRCRVLYVEDHAESVALVQQLLAERSYVLLHAKDADQAIELARAERPEVILLNVDPPGPGRELDAIAFMELLRSQSATRTTPVLALSASATAEAVVKGLEAGFFQYLAKPVQAKPLMEALAYALEFAAIERSEQGGPPSRRRAQTSKESR